MRFTMSRKTGSLMFISATGFRSGIPFGNRFFTSCNRQNNLDMNKNEMNIGNILLRLVLPNISPNSSCICKYIHRVKMLYELKTKKNILKNMLTLQFKYVSLSDKIHCTHSTLFTFWALNYVRQSKFYFRNN